MIVYLATIGALLAMLGIVVPQSISLYRAHRTGIITGSGYAGARIDREEDPDRFNRFWHARRPRLTLPIILFFVALVFGAVQTLGLVTTLAT